MSQAGEIDVIGTHPEIPTEFVADVGSAVPIANVLELLGEVVAAGTNPFRSIGSGNTITYEVQIAQAIASTNATNIGLAAFNSSQFTVDANGFVSLSGGGLAVDSFQVQSITAPGVNPVAPTAAGLVTVNGSAVANHSVVLETRSRALNTFNLEIQYATSSAATDATKSGVAHFDSTQFSVDANGFVTLAGAGAAIDSIGVDATSGGGTNPVLPTAAGLITVNGARVAAGTNPIRSVSTAANVYQIQVQTSQALATTDATKVGLSNFDSSSFAVDANGFVTASATGLGKTITGNTGGALSPTAGNWNILGNNTALNGFATYNTGSGSTLTVNSFGTNIWVVNPTAGVGTHTTIQAAVTAASAGDTVFVTAKSTAYTENITAKAGVNIVADTADAFTPNVTIAGTITHNTAGTVSISGIRLQTNSAALLAVTGSAASVVNLINCYLNCSNNTGITYNSSSGSSEINITNCKGNLGNTGISLYVHSSAGRLQFENCKFTNSGGSSTASTCSAGILDAFWSVFNFPTTFSGTSGSTWEYVGVVTTSQNVTSLRAGGTSHSAKWCRFSSGTASSVVIVTASFLQMEFCDISSSNTNAITGGGTLQLGNASFTSSSNKINTITQTPLISVYGLQRSSTQPAFLANLSTTQLNKTGNGTQYTLGTAALTKIYDQNNNFNTNGTFTAPLTGRYHFSAGIRIVGCTTASFIQFYSNQSNRQYHVVMGRNSSSSDLGAQLSMVADMDAGDTATWIVLTIGEAGATNDVYGDGNCQTYISGYLEC